MGKLQEIEARWAIIAEEPWKCTSGGAVLDAQDRRIALLDGSENGIDHPYLLRETAKAIAAGPDDVAWLVGEVERLTASLRDAAISSDNPGCLCCSRTEGLARAALRVEP